jgi:hypothetical protein
VHEIIPCRSYFLTGNCNVLYVIQVNCSEMTCIKIFGIEIVKKFGNEKWFMISTCYMYIALVVILHIYSVQKIKIHFTILKVISAPPFLISYKTINVANVYIYNTLLFDYIFPPFFAMAILICNMQSFFQTIHEIMANTIYLITCIYKEW